jgi:hypothetical protein
VYVGVDTDQGIAKAFTFDGRGKFFALGVCASGFYNDIMRTYLARQPGREVRAWEGLLADPNGFTGTGPLAKAFAN